MIFGNSSELVSPIVLSVLLIIYLMLVEFGNENMKKIFKPIIIALMAVFVVVVFQNIASKW